MTVSRSPPGASESFALSSTLEEDSRQQEGSASDWPSSLSHPSPHIRVSFGERPRNSSTLVSFLEEKTPAVPLAVASDGLCTDVPAPSPSFSETAERALSPASASSSFAISAPSPSFPFTVPSCPSSPSSLFSPDILLPPSERSRLAGTEKDPVEPEEIQQAEARGARGAAVSFGEGMRLFSLAHFALSWKREKSEPRFAAARNEGEIETGSVWGLYMLASLALAAAASLTRHCGGESARKKSGDAKRERLFRLLDLPLPPPLPLPSLLPPQSSSPSRSPSASSSSPPPPLPWLLGPVEACRCAAAGGCHSAPSAACPPFDAFASSFAQAASKPGPPCVAAEAPLSHLQPRESPFSSLVTPAGALEARCACASPSQVSPCAGPLCAFASVVGTELFFARQGRRVALLYEGWTMKESRWRRVWRRRYLMLFAVTHGPCEALDKASVTGMASRIPAARRIRGSSAQTQAHLPLAARSSTFTGGSDSVSRPETPAGETVSGGSGPPSARFSLSLESSLWWILGRAERKQIGDAETRKECLDFSSASPFSPRPLSLAKTNQCESRSAEEATGAREQSLRWAPPRRPGEERDARTRRREERECATQFASTPGSATRKRSARGSDNSERPAAWAAEDERATGRCETCSRVQLFLAAYEVNPRCTRRREMESSETGPAAPSQTSYASFGHALRCPHTPFKSADAAECAATPARETEIGEEQKALASLLAYPAPPPTDIVTLSTDMAAEILPAVLPRARLQLSSACPFLAQEAARGSSSSASHIGPESSPHHSVGGRKRRQERERRQLAAAARREELLSHEALGTMWAMAGESDAPAEEEEERDDEGWECVERPAERDAESDFIECETLVLRSADGRRLRLAPCSAFLSPSPCGGCPHLPTSARRESCDTASPPAPSPSKAWPPAQRACAASLKSDASSCRGSPPLSCARAASPLRSALPRLPVAASHLSGLSAALHAFSPRVSESAGSTTAPSPALSCSSSCASSRLSSDIFRGIGESACGAVADAEEVVSRLRESHSPEACDDWRAAHGAGAARAEEATVVRRRSEQADGDSGRGWCRAARREREAARATTEGERQHSGKSARDAETWCKSNEEDESPVLLAGPETTGRRAEERDERAEEVGGDRVAAEEKIKQCRGGSDSYVSQEGRIGAREAFRLQSVDVEADHTHSLSSCQMSPSGCGKETASRELRMWADAVNLVLSSPCLSSSSRGAASASASCPLCPPRVPSKGAGGPLPPCRHTSRQPRPDAVASARPDAPEVPGSLLPFLGRHPSLESSIPPSSPLQLFLSPCRFASLSADSQLRERAPTPSGSPQAPVQAGGCGSGHSAAAPSPAAVAAAAPPGSHWRDQELLLLSLLQAERRQGRGACLWAPLAPAPPPRFAAGLAGGDASLAGTASGSPEAESASARREGESLSSPQGRQGLDSLRFVSQGGVKGAHDRLGDNWVRSCCDQIGFDELRLRLFTYAVANRGGA
ncbi:hypothetical protein BESB_081610 [Besnoitia besnoiti]|uniref:Uncharacterized protein n=1 Tax=Besnoitia besnoiti TaxID=94643 RepID=A0A2A9MC42_BESBE|nr:hypothetical protein BESB_081610 [Besnoitia besnoiti]PFH32962.1 hypothetical protein BESB_081610 [Besnoitia besnoiti]